MDTRKSSEAHHMMDPTLTHSGLYPLAWLQQGFLPFRGSLMLDVVFVAMFAILPALIISLWLVRNRNFRSHRNLQLGLAVVLLVAVVLFEIDMRFFTDWRELAKPSSISMWCPTLLAVHLCFAIPTPFVWGWIIVGALRSFDANFQAPGYRERHRFLGWCGMGLMFGTAVTGIIFYIAAFIL